MCMIANVKEINNDNNNNNNKNNNNNNNNNNNKSGIDLYFVLRNVGNVLHLIFGVPKS